MTMDHFTKHSLNIDQYSNVSLNTSSEDHSTLNQNNEQGRAHTSWDKLEQLGPKLEGMRLSAACLVCLLLLCVVLPNAGSRIFERSMEIRNPDINPSWYTGRGIRPVGRFGRRRAAAESSQKLSYGHRQACFPIVESNESMQDE